MLTEIGKRLHIHPTASNGAEFGCFFRFVIKCMDLEINPLCRAVFKREQESTLLITSGVLQLLTIKALFEVIATMNINNTL